MGTRVTERSGERSGLLMIVTMVAICAAVSVSLRFGSGILEKGHVRDEHLMKVPIDDILDRGWSVETAIDYQEVKGPSFFWSYALAGEVLGGSMNDMRLTSSAFFVLGLVPLLLIARRAGFTSPGCMAGITALWMVLPYNAFAAQLLFSEPSFNCFALWTTWAFVWGVGDSRHPAHRVAGPILFALGLCVIMHHRPHAVAFGAAAALVATQRERGASWPWWAACVAAGLLRLPLFLRWGGMVTSNYQGLFGFGLRIDALVYMFAALTPLMIVFLWPVMRDTTRPPSRLIVIGAGVLTMALALIVTPDLAAQVTYTLPATGETDSQMEYGGTVATLVRTVSETEAVRRLLIAALAGVGAASFAAFVVVCTARPVTETTGVVTRFAMWTLVSGIPLYVITKGPVYDRYLLVWTVLMPVVWLRALPRWLTFTACVVYGAMLVYLVGRYL